MKNIKSTKNANKANTATSNEGYGLGSGKDGWDGITSEGHGLGSSKDAREGFMSDAIASKAFTAWGVEVNGEIDPRDIFPVRMWARIMRNDYAEHFPSEAKVSVRKVLIIPVSDR